MAIDPESPLGGLHFAIEIAVPGLSHRVCNAAFAECDGLDMRMQVRTIREGGDNTRQIHFAGPVSYSNLRLRRGMTRTFDLWEWFARTAEAGGSALRSTSAVVVLLQRDAVTPQVRFVLQRCLPVRLTGPTLDALAGIVAIEELELAYESLRVEQPA
jgi:phage tail-like protein